MDCFAHMIISPKRKRYITYTSTYFSKRHFLFNFTRCFYKVNCIIVMLFYTSCNRKNVWVENNILWIEVNLLGQYFISSFADINFPLPGIGLASFVKSHNNN